MVATRATIFPTYGKMVTLNGDQNIFGFQPWHRRGEHKKGAADARRGKLFSKLSRAIIVAAKEGGPDPAGNLAL